MATNGTVVEIELPCGLSTCDITLLQRCEGKVLFLRSVRSRISLSEVDYQSYCNGGVEPDTLTLMAAYRVRFPAVIIRVVPGRMSAVALGTGPIPAGLTLCNTGPFDLCNGETICFMPSVFDCVCNRVRLESINSDIVFPATIPSSIYGEVLGKILAMAVETLTCEHRNNADRTDGTTNPPPRDADVVTYNGRRIPISPCVRRLDSLEPCVRTLVLNMMFSITEGTMLLLAMVPYLLTLGATDGYVDTLIGLQSATRTAGQLIQIPRARPYEDSDRRFPLFTAIAAWINMAQYMGETLAAKPMLKVCTFDGPSSAKPGECIPVISNWF